METVEIPERYTKKTVRALKKESEIALYLKAVGEKLEALMGEIKDDREQRKQWAACRETGRQRKADMECHSCHQKGHLRGSARPMQPKDARETGSRRHHNRRGAQEGAATEETVMVGN